MSEEAITPDWSREQHEAFANCRASRIARNATTSMGVMAAARDYSIMSTYTDTYGIAIPKVGDITNQRQSGRCWMFSAFNVLRQEAMRILDVDSFELSQAYGMFYDKLEKANSTLEYAIQTAELSTESREVEYLMEFGVSDGGYYPSAMNLVAKYGLVPKSVMPETASSKNSSEMNDQLWRVVRKGTMALRKAHAAGRGAGELRELKQEIMADVWKVLATCLGEPPITFDFELKVGKDAKVDQAKLSPVEPAPKKGEGDEDEKPSLILRDFGITPQQFAERYVQVDPKGFVSLVSIPGTLLPFGKVYHLTLTDPVMGGMPGLFLNVEPEVLEDAAVASLRAGYPLAMACDVMQKFPRHVEDFRYVLSTDAMDLDGLFGVDLSMSRQDMVDIHETCLTHAMTFQGVELGEDGRPKAWRVENSWGKDQGKDGFLVMSADWFNLYGGEVDVRREFVPAELLKLWDESEPVEVGPWSGMGRALGRPRS
ncbi:C1 family peptidase [Olsenella urininfantis]|uniref:aminopeptidase C n=1 Tax=Olsenella urininfantis TaxID=1871033 RepID=UPI00098506AB|nr:C1 family peptidase [Olsenella urininfantis]